MLPAAATWRGALPPRPVSVPLRHHLARWLARYGVAEIVGTCTALDALVVRPLTMGLGMRAIGDAGGVLAGKLAADVVFHLVVIPIHEARRQSRHAMPPR